MTGAARSQRPLRHCSVDPSLRLSSRAADRRTVYPLRHDIQLRNGAASVGGTARAKSRSVKLVL